MEEYTDPQILYDEICKRLPKLRDVNQEHFFATAHSSATQSVALNMLLDGRKEWTAELYNEMASLFGSIKNVESAGVPVDMKVAFELIFRPTSFTDSFDTCLHRNLVELLLSANIEMNLSKNPLLVLWNNLKMIKDLLEISSDSSWLVMDIAV